MHSIYRIQTCSYVKPIFLVVSRVWLSSSEHSLSFLFLLSIANGQGGQLGWWKGFGVEQMGIQVLGQLNGVSLCVLICIGKWGQQNYFKEL